MTETYGPKPLTARQREILGEVREQKLLDALNQVLVDRGLPLRVHEVVYAELPAAPASNPIGPDPSAIPDPPPGGAYHCWQETVGGPLICECLSSGPPPIASHAPQTISQ
jgi:hypothetical protein